MWTKLTDKEFAETGLAESWRDFAYWDDDGCLVTVACHEGALKQLMPKQPTDNDNAKKRNTEEETDEGDQPSA